MVKEVVRRDSLKGRRGRLSSKARCQMNEHMHSSSYGESVSESYTTTGQTSPHIRRSTVLNNSANLSRRLMNPISGCLGNGQRINPTSTVNSTVTLLSMLTKAYELVGPNASDGSELSTCSTREACFFNSMDKPIGTDTQEQSAARESYDLAKICNAIQKSIHEIRRYAELVPGFTSLNSTDREILLKMHSLDLLSLRLALRCTDMKTQYRLSSSRDLAETYSNQATGFTNSNVSIPTAVTSIACDSDSRSVSECLPNAIDGSHNEDKCSSDGPPWTDPHSFRYFKASEITNSSHLNYQTTPLYQFENGAIFTFDQLSAAGLGDWGKQLWESGMRIRALIQNDWSAIAGLAALTLVNYKSINYQTPLSKPSEIYALHHRFVEMLKSHCCATVYSSQTNTNSTTSGYASRKSFRLHTDTIPVATSRIVDSTYFSKVFQQKDHIRLMTKTSLLVPLMRLVDNESTVHTWLKEIVELVGNSD
ncbi:hypothetical protein EG68_02502 [Paragonimus skrjabini miyazakii]|uniref:NR LBD domain-containing protein n=1 Tax=Paragonimus skrjabini miyazakii TaxID=59628 RepID=A0A8S9Z931_9TREM|nr:hypothetical protein EG68_02502 [Paragonimus skrjabini miyazakii]